MQIDRPDSILTKVLTINDLKEVHQFLSHQTLEFDGKIIHGMQRLNGKEDIKPFLLLVQLHGNEPAGLAAALYCLSLAKYGYLEKPVMIVVGNLFASTQYFQVYKEETPSYLRDVFRSGVDENGQVLEDLNRIPTNFKDSNLQSVSYQRWHELDHIANQIYGILDIHTARGGMICVTTSSNDSLIKTTPIKIILDGLLDAIGHATDRLTLKNYWMSKSNIEHNFGIEAGSHEDSNSFSIAIHFTANLLYSLGISSHKPMTFKGDLVKLKVEDKLSFSDLICDNYKENLDNQLFYTVTTDENKIAYCSQLIVNDSDVYKIKPNNGFIPEGSYGVYQYDELEEIEKNQIVAVSVPSGVTLKSPHKMQVLFVSKSSTFYNDETIGLYPVAANNLKTKFCYPCFLSEIISNTQQIGIIQKKNYSNGSF